MLLRIWLRVLRHFEPGRERPCPECQTLTPGGRPCSDACAAAWQQATAW